MPRYESEDNYYNDHRVRGKDRRWWKQIDQDRMKALAVFYDEEGEEVEEWVPFEFQVCGTCQGRGKHVNPSIDCDGLTAEDFAEDPDFEEAYFRGDYDITCTVCNGKRVVPVPDLERCAAEQKEMIERQEECERMDEEDRRVQLRESGIYY